MVMLDKEKFEGVNFDYLYFQIFVFLLIFHRLRARIFSLKRVWKKIEGKMTNCIIKMFKLFTQVRFNSKISAKYNKGHGKVGQKKYFQLTGGIKIIYFLFT